VKKGIIGCLAVAGGFFVIIMAIGVITTFMNPPAATTTPTTTKPAAVETMPATTAPAYPTQPTQQTQPTAPLTLPTTTTSGQPTSQIIPTAPALHMELADAEYLELIEVSAAATGNPDSVKLTLTSTSSSSIEITVSPGVIFDPLPECQSCSLVVIQEQKVFLPVREYSVTVDVATASLEMGKAAPGAGEGLELGFSGASGDLQQLLVVGDFLDEPSFRLKQFGIWVVNDNPMRDDFPAAGCPELGSPNDAEVEQLRSLFARAGLDPEQYRTLTTAMFLELLDARNQGLIEVSATGIGSLERVVLSMTSKSERILDITIPIGIIFDSLSSSIQGMVVIAPKSVVLHPFEASVKVNVEAACANMRLDMPEETDSLVMRAEPAGGDLIKLLELPEFQNQTYRVQQFAIWTITDNPTSDGYVGIATGYQIWGTGPSTGEIETMRTLFILAGIDTGQYKVFQ